MDVVGAIKDVLDLVFPAHCAGCGAMLPPGRTVCAACAETLEPLKAEDCCPTCMDAIYGGACGRCRANPPPFARVHAPLLYGGAVKDAIHRLKFGDAPWAARALVDLAWPVTPPDWRSLDVLVPVPLHRTRHRERGYNQARLLASVLSERTGVAVSPHALVRVKATVPVAELPLDQRAAVVEDAFVKGDETAVRGRRVALVDDVVTTSATVRAACAVLRDMGAASVDVICMARGGHGSES